MNTASEYPNVGRLLSQRAKEDPRQIFAYFKEATITLQDLDEKSNRLANSLRRLGFQKGKKVAVISHTNIEYLIAEFGIFKSSAACVPMNSLLKAHEITYLLENAGVEYAFVHKDCEEEFLKATSSRNVEYSVIDAVEGSFSKLLEASSDPPEITTGPDDIACIMYTSGTTGVPKGVIYEHYGLLPRKNETYVQQMMDAIGLGPEDTTYLPFALYHILGQVHIVSALRNGGKIALTERFSASRFWEEVRKYGATVLVHQGASIPLLLKQPPSHADRKHKARLSVGAGVPNEQVWHQFESRFGVKIYEHYAQTEGSFFGAGTMPTNRCGTIGLPYSSAEIRLLDQNERDVKEGESGQLASRLKKEYARKKAEDLYYNDRQKGISRFTSDGWFKSGDIVCRDRDGYLHYVGKVETFIRYRGENISPLQIEAVFSKHELIDECIAVGVPNSEFGGEDIKIVITTKEQPSLSPAELIAWCQDKFPKYMIPRYVEFVPELKKTEQTKKIVRSEYRANSPQTWDRLAASSGELK
ncbi:MAG: AMP-binding protein [Nitrososphaerota archaeon]|nr:AMP-binding protein [Nitrososphaerota archaeon]